jgi:PAS domain S-box-containing protein
MEEYSKNMASVKNSYLEFKNAIILSSLLSILIPVIGSVYFIYFLAEWKWVDTSIHLLVEALGSFAALSIASLILIMRRNNKIPGYYEWVSSALISMGALDILHVSLPPGDAFVWLYSMAILVGGSLFALVWLPARRFVQLRSDYTVPITVAILSIILGAFSIAVPSVLPKMLTNGDFTFTADSINVLGGALFLTAAVYFIIRYRNNGNSNDILFFNFAMLNGWAGLIFPFSELWCSCWWFFHLLRLAAYFTVITYVFSAFQLREKELIHVNETLQAEVSKRRQSEEAASELLKELKAMFDNLPLGIAYFDTEYKALNANKIHYSQIGLSEEEYIGKYCYETVGEYASDPARKGREKICSFCKFEESIKTKCPISIERRLRDSIIRMTIVPQFEKDGTVSHFMKVVEDITERKRSEEELKLSDEKYRTLIDNIQDGAFIVQDAKLQFVNEAFAGMGGYTVKEVIGKEFQQFIAPEDRDIVAERYQRRQAGENVPKEYEFHLLHKDGKTRILVNMTVGLSTYYGKVASIGTVKDITEKKKLEAQLILAQRMESIGTLAQGIAHDMNNVLSPIMLSLYMLKERFTDSESQELIEILESGAKRGADLIKQIRLFTLGIESKRVSLQVAPLISEISQIAKETFPRNIEVKTNISENLWTILGDATQLHQILMNLCVNARDAMPDGGVLSISAENTSVD